MDGTGLEWVVLGGDATTIIAGTNEFAIHACLARCSSRWLVRNGLRARGTNNYRCVMHSIISAHSSELQLKFTVAMEITRPLMHWVARVRRWGALSHLGAKKCLHSKRFI